MAAGTPRPFLAALRHDRIDAPWLVDGPINGERFRIYVQDVLVPTLKPGDIVIMDKPRLSQVQGRATGHPPSRRPASVPAQVLPPTSIPSRQVFAKLRHLLRHEAPRTVEAVSAAIGRLLDTYTPKECANYFKNAGYDPT